MKKGSLSRLNCMLKADFRHMYKSSLLYVMLGICLLVPILMLIMTGMNEEESSKTFTNAWQMIGSLPNSSSSSLMSGEMDMISMMNINMLLFAVGVLSSIFVSVDFSSGYIKNYLVVRNNRTDYVLSKMIVLLSASALLYVTFFIGTVLGGAFAGLSFSMEGFNVLNLIMCILSKILLSGIFIAIFVTCACFAKDKLWMSILISLGFGMILFMMVPMITPLTSNLINVLLTFAGSIIFSIPLSLVGNIFLTKLRVA